MPSGRLRMAMKKGLRMAKVSPPRPSPSTLLGSVEKSRSGIAAGVLNATRQTGSVLGVALFGSLVGQSAAFMAGLHASLVIAAGVLLAAAIAVLWGTPTNSSGIIRPDS